MMGLFNFPWGKNSAGLKEQERSIKRRVSSNGSTWSRIRTMCTDIVMAFTHKASREKGFSKHAILKNAGLQQHCSSFATLCAPIFSLRPGQSQCFPISTSSFEIILWSAKYKGDPLIPSELDMQLIAHLAGTCSLITTEVLYPLSAPSAFAITPGHTS
jgi:hypothetical protein